MVLVAGGLDGNDILNTAELYDPSTGTWTRTGNMSDARLDHTASVLMNGMVLVAGGRDGPDELIVLSCIIHQLEHGHALVIVMMPDLIIRHQYYKWNGVSCWWRR